MSLPSDNLEQRLEQDIAQLSAYIRETRILGWKDKEIIKELKKAGWKKPLIAKLLTNTKIDPKLHGIEVRNLNKTYDNNGVRTVALHDIDLSIQGGEFVAIMGSSGSGKSTLMHILGLLDEPTSGSYRLAGKEVSYLKPAEQALVRNQEIGFVFQQFNLLPRTTVFDNIFLPTIYSSRKDKNYKKRAVDLIQKVGLTDRIKHKSNQLSGGQIQRVAIARALVMNPHMILADEPTGNLDSKTSAEIVQVFQSINQEGVTVIMVTHEEEIARHAKRIIKLKDGKIISDGPNNHA